MTFAEAISMVGRLSASASATNASSLRWSILERYLWSDGGELSLDDSLQEGIELSMIRHPKMLWQTSDDTIRNAEKTSTQLVRDTKSSFISLAERYTTRQAKEKLHRDDAIIQNGDNRVHGIRQNWRISYNFHKRTQCFKALSMPVHRKEIRTSAIFKLTQLVFQCYVQVLGYVSESF